MPDVSDVLTGGLRLVDEEALRDWIVEQRWFASKASRVAGIEIAEVIPLRDEEPVLTIALVEARFPAGTHEVYQVPLGLRPVDAGWSERVVCSDRAWTVYDALADPACGRELLHHLRAADVLATEHGQLAFFWEGGAANGGEVDIRAVGGEQSNSSIVFGDSLVLKAFRRLEPGVNPELELLRFLSAHGFESIPALAGWYEYSGSPMAATMGIVQQFLAGARDGWELTLDEFAESRRSDALIARLGQLGTVTGEMHSVLGSDASDPAFAPDEPSTEARSLLIATVEEQIDRVFANLPEEDPLVRPLVGRGDDVRAALTNLTQLGVGGRVIRNHGDYHLGQTLLDGDRWVIIDFEGEPARSLPERRQKRSPLRDVAGMLRSFAYAASASEILRGVAAPPDWENRAREAFLSAYFDSVDPSLMPPGQEAIEKMLAVLELEKAVYELSYELNNRPEWVGIPVAGILRLLEESS